MLLDYSTSKKIAQAYYEEAYKQFYCYGMNVYQAHKRAVQEVLSLRVNPFTEQDEIDVTACNDFVRDLEGGVSV